MRHLLWVFGVLLLCHVSVRAQALQGYVVANRMGGAPLPGVKLSLGECQTVTTGADGGFSFKADASSCPVSARISAQMEGRVVVNDVLLGDALGPHSGTQPLTLVMAPATAQSAWRSNYFLQQVSAIPKGPQRPEPEVPSDGQYTSGNVSGVKRLIAVAPTWELLASKGPPEEMPPLYREGLRTWWRVNAERALSALSLDALHKQESATQPWGGGLAQAWMLRAMLQVARGDLADAMNTVDMAAKVLPTEADVWHFRGQVLLAQPAMAYDKEALTSLQRAVRLRPLSENARPSLASASLHDTLGALQEVIGHIDEARRHWVIAYKLYADLRPQGHVHFTDLASRAALNAARMQLLRKQPAVALRTLADVLAWRRELAEEEPSLMRQYYIAIALLNRQHAQEDLRKWCDAEASRDEARRILADLAQLDPLRFQVKRNQVERSILPPLPVSTDCHRYKVVMTASMGTVPDLPKRKALADIPPEHWDDHIKQWLKESSRIMGSETPNAAAEAAKWTLLVLDLQLRRYKASSGQFDLNVAKTLVRLGSLHQMSGKPELALTSYQYALDFWDPARQPVPPHPWTADIIATLKWRIQHLSREAAATSSNEPSFGLSPIMVDNLVEVVKDVSKQGVAVLLVEQNAHRALELTDRAYGLLRVR